MICPVKNDLLNEETDQGGWDLNLNENRILLFNFPICLCISLHIGQPDSTNEPIYHKNQRTGRLPPGSSVCCWRKLPWRLRSGGEP